MTVLRIFLPISIGSTISKTTIPCYCIHAGLCAKELASRAVSSNIKPSSTLLCNSCLTTREQGGHEKGLQYNLGLGLSEGCQSRQGPGGRTHQADDDNKKDHCCKQPDFSASGSDVRSRGATVTHENHSICEVRTGFTSRPG
jgi:hypothetical protein